MSDYDKTAAVAALFEHFDAGRQPGAAVMVIHDGDVVFSGGFGYANLAEDQLIDQYSTFRLASVSKQFTAMAIMVLAEEGKLDFDDPVTRFLPQLSNFPGVTIRHLMTHTAGLPDYYDSIDTSEGRPVNDDLVDILAKSEAVFAPGERYEYSNPAYEMLALIVEKASGMPFRDFMEARVFVPAGMDDSLIRDHTEPEIANRVLGYSPSESGFDLNDDDPLNFIVGSGGMYTTLEDFYAWDQALYEDAVVAKETLDSAFTRHVLNDAREIDYGFGWRLDLYRGHARIAHGGSWVGFRTGIARFPDENLTIVVLTNRSDGNPGGYIDRIADIYMPGEGTLIRPADTMAAVQAYHRKVPTDDIWWTVTGEQMRWMHLNAHQLFPTVNVYRSGAVSELEYAPMAAIGQHEVMTPEGPLPLDWFLESDHSTAMGVVILNKGKIVYEKYPRMQSHEKPIYWSVAKVMPATVVRLLEERGKVDVSQPIEKYIPKLASSDFAGITVRHILDMATGLDCHDEYEDRQSCYYQYSMAIGDGFRDENAPDNPYDYLSTLEVSKHNAPGKQFSYSGVSTFVLGWLVEEITGHPFQDVFTNEIWRHIGAENDASFIAYRYGIPLTHGGFLSNLRDLARFGLLFTPSYDVVSAEKIISDSHIDLLLNGGDPNLLRAVGVPPPEESGISHNVYQWDRVYTNGSIYKGGWGGQGLLVNPEHDVVAVYASYFKDDFSEMSLDDVVFEVVDSVFVNASQE